MTSFDTINAHVRNALVGGSAGAVLGSDESIVICVCCACACALLMVIIGQKQAIMPQGTQSDVLIVSGQTHTFLGVGRAIARRYVLATPSPKRSGHMASTVSR